MGGFMNSLLKSSSIMILISLLFSACRESEIEKKEKIQIAFLSQNCFSCHSPNMEQKEKLAPAMGEIRLRYRNLISSKTEFISAINKYLSSPGFETTQNKDWVVKYGNMPKMIFHEQRLEDALSYLYHTEVDSQEWWNTKQSLLADKKTLQKILSENMTLLEIAQQSAHQTKSALGSKLMSSLLQKGELGALEFCNVNAQKITKEKSTELQAEIKRVSDKPRNQLNAASEIEVGIIETYKLNLAKKTKLQPRTFETDKTFTAYFPIETNDTCLKCHGVKGKDIKKEVTRKILELYPEDTAVGYKTNEIRGLFKVTLSKTK